MNEAEINAIKLICRTLMRSVVDDYCRHCWRRTDGERCHCENDE